MNRDEPQFFDVHALPTERLADPPVAQGLAVQVVSRASSGGALTLLARLPAGWRLDEPGDEATLEAFVLEGNLELAGSGRVGAGGFVSVPQGTGPARLSSAAGAHAFLFWSPGLDLPGELPRTASTYSEQWSPSGLPGMLHISFRRPDTDGPPPGGPGGFLRLFSVAPGFRLDSEERHACWEENIMLRGDMWMAGRGTLRAGWCVANPPGLWHGPMVSKGGAVLLVHCDRPHTLEYRDWQGSPQELARYVESAPWAS